MNTCMIVQSAVRIVVVVVMVEPVKVSVPGIGGRVSGQGASGCGNLSSECPVIC